MDNTKTKERTEYEKSLKNMHELSLKAALSEEGIDTSIIPRKKFDDIKRLLDKQGSVRQKHQEIINKLQQDAQAAIARAQQDMQAELNLIQTGVEQIVAGIKADQGIMPVVPLPQGTQEPAKPPDAESQAAESKTEEND